MTAFFTTVLCPYERENENLRIINGLKGTPDKKKPDLRFHIPEGWKGREQMREWFLKNGFREINYKEIK